MKKLNLLVILGLLCVTSWFACKKDKKESQFKPVVTENLTWSKNSTEQNKAKVEESGVALVNNLDLLEQCNAMAAMAGFDSAISVSDPFQKEEVITKKLSALVGLLGQKNKSPLAIQKKLKDVAEDSTLSQQWASSVGVYTWNVNSKTWTKTTASGKIEFIFPSVAGGTTNDGLLTINNFKNVVIKEPVTDNLGNLYGDYPTALNVTMSVSGSKVMSYSFAASYDNQGTPQNLSTSLSMCDFSISMLINNSSSRMSEQFTVKNGSTVLFETGSYLNGDFSSTALAKDSALSYYATDGAIYMQIMDVRIEGVSKVRTLVDELNKIQESDLSSDQITTKVTELYNKYITVMSS